MKKKFFIVMAVFSVLSLAIGVYVILSIEDATSTLNNLINLHRIGMLRSRLLLQIKTTQSDLYLKNTRHARDYETVMNNVTNMPDVSKACLGCHHSEEVTKTLLELKARVEDYRESFKRAFVEEGDSSLVQQHEDAAFLMGEDLLKEVDDLICYAGQRLGTKTESSLQAISRTKVVTFFLVGIGPFVTVILTVILVRGFTKPINTVLHAIKTLKSGDLSCRISGLKDECGVVASQFNEMVASLNEHLRTMQRAEQMTMAGEMAASIAHEIKNPLTGLSIALRMLSENKDLTRDENEIVEASFLQIKRMESLIKEMLDFARPKEPEYCTVNMNALVEKTVSFVAGLPFQSGGGGGITVVKSLCGDCPDILVDPMQMQQAVMNVVMNARDAMPEGGTLTIRTSHSGPSFVISVADTGGGIDGGDIEKLFKPFYTTKASGTGLGLPITKGIVERHGGTITVESTVGKGTTVTLTLPRTGKAKAGEENG